MTPFDQARYSQECTITSNAYVGDTGTTIIASNVPCTPTYPAGQDWNIDTATGIDYHEMFLYLVSPVDIKDGHVVTVGSQKYTIQRRKKWTANERSLLLEERF